MNTNPHMIRTILFTDEAYFTGNGINTRNSHLWDHSKPHRTVASNYQHGFSAMCGVIGDQLIGPNVFPQRLRGDIYANVLQHELPALLENAPF
jgi:hypothetical protein